MSANVVSFSTPFQLQPDETYVVAVGTTVSEWLISSGFQRRISEQPTVLLLNGDELLEADMGHAFEDGDLLVLTPLAQDPATIAAVVSFIVEYWVVIALVTTVALVLSAPEPDMPNGVDQQEGSPTYSISARGNRARLGQPKPVIYGRMRTYPDLAAQPFTQFERGEDQVLFQLFEVSQGEVVIDPASMRFEDTPLSNFEDYEVEVIPPGAKSTIFPSGAVTSSEVSNIVLESTVLGPYVVTAVGQDVSRIAVDMVAPGGLFNQSRKSGALRAYTVRYKIEAREIDQADMPVGVWLELGVESMSGDSRDAIRVTHDYSIDEGRYEVRITRLTPKDASMYVNDILNWAQLRGFLADGLPITTTTRVAVKIRASEQLGNKALSKFNLVASRKIPVWSSGIGWSAAVETSSPSWVFADICRASYGASRSDAYIDLAGLEALATQFGAEDTEFNGVFDSKGNVWEALTKVAQSARAMPVDRAGVYHMVRDAYVTVPIQMFTMRNIVKNSFNIVYAGVLEETADAVVVEYFDREQDYRHAEMTCALTGSPASNPRRVRLFGVTNKDQAFKLGMYMAAQNQYRRENVTFTTGIEGRIPMYGDLIAVSHFMLGQEGTKQVSGDVVAYDGVDTLVVHEDISDFTNPYIVLRALDGAPGTAYQCVAVGSNKIRIVEAFDDSVLQFDAGYERPHFMVGEGVDFFANVKVTKIEPDSGNKIKVSGFIDDPLVYTAADGLQVPPITSLPGGGSIAPVVSDLTAELQGTVDDPIVILTWKGENADHYIVEFSTDGGNAWLPISPLRETRLEHHPEPGVVLYRVAGVNILRGVWVSVIADTQDAQFALPPAATNLVLAEAFTGPTLRLQWDSDVEDHQVVFKVASVEKYAETVTAKAFELSATVAAEHGLGRAFDVDVYSVGPNGKRATAPATLAVSNPPPGQLNNLVVTPFLGVAKVDFDWPADTDLAGISVWASLTDGFTPNNANLAIDRSLDPVLGVPLDEGQTLYIRVAAVDVWGSDVNYSGQFTVVGKTVDLTSIQNDLATLNGKFPIDTVDITNGAITSPKVAANTISAIHIIAQAITGALIAALTIEGDNIKANTLTADKLSVAYLSAITADLGLVTAGTVQTTSGTGYRVELSSSGNWPFWIGSGAIKNEANGLMYINKTTEKLTYKGDIDVKSATSGARLEIKNNVIKVFDAVGTLRVKLGDLS